MSRVQVADLCDEAASSLTPFAYITEKEKGRSEGWKETPWHSG